MEYEVILVQSKERFHMLNFPLTNIEQLKQYYSLADINYKPLSTGIQMDFISKEPMNDQLKEKVTFESKVTQNKTYYALAKLDEDLRRIYIYPIFNFQSMKPSANKTTIIEKEQEQPANELLYNRNKAKMLEQQKKQYKWQKKLKQQEQSINLNKTEKQLQVPDNITQLKPIAQHEYQRSFQQVELFFKSLQIQNKASTLSEIQESSLFN
ncbi:hypothetical protein pb186bvf_009911 [Paramecium bursaria]